METEGTLGELCTFERGVSATLKTLPGEYPLVVTAEFRRSADSWQIEGPAVCIPLVSSTGHGDAALHRVHYQDGRFALANLLVALKPRDPQVLDPRFLYHLLMRRKDQLLVPLMLGTANVSLKEKDIAGVRVPVPPMHKQRSIVDLIEAIAGKTEEARRLRREAESAADNLCRSILSHAATVKHVSMGSLVTLRPSDIRVQPNQVYQFAGVYSFGRGVFRSVRKSGSEFSYERLTALRAGDFVYPKLMAWEGALGVVPPECDGCAVSPEFPTFEVDQSQVLPEVLDVHFRTPSVWPDIAALSTGTNVRRRRVHPSAFMTYMFPLPDMATQKCMVGARHALNRASGVGASLCTELDAMLPAVLDKAFRGEM